MAELNQLTVATHRYIRQTPKLVDMVFQGGPVIAYAKQNVREDFPGGRQIGENFWYAGLIGGPYLPGKEFDITEPQVEQQLQFTMRFFEVGVTLSKEDVQVLNTGPMAAFRLIDSRMQNAYATIGAHMELGMFLNGVNANYTPNFNGLPEALNDNTTVSWDNNLYSTYGTITRGGATGTVLSSAPQNVSGTIEYNTLEERYGDATFGNIEPNLGVTTVICRSFIKEKFQPQQRFVDVVEPKIGFRGFQFNGATVIASRYCPGTHLFQGSGTNDPVAVTFMRQMSNGALVAYPAPVGGYPAGTTPSETFWWLNARKPFMNFYMSTDAEYGLGFTGWKPGQGNTKVAGQVLASVQVTFAPRYHRQMYGITG